MWKLLAWIKVPCEKELLNTAVLLGCIYTCDRDYPLDMNHHDRSGDSASTRKMVYPARRESSGINSVGGSSSLTASGSTSLNSNNFMLGDDYSPPVLVQSQTPATSSLGPQNPPQSLNIPLQSTLLPQTLPTAVTQMKKKSGFQITSVTPAQISVSTNNSITEDTESCDDLDESHTEDLSSSEILDVSLSRANNAGGPERSSSEETLNNFHEAETPGAMSPNQPPIPTQAHPHGTMVNGTVHHHHHHHHNHVQHPIPSGKALPAVVGAGGTPIGIPLGVTLTSAVTSSSGALASTGQKMPSNVVEMIENASVGTTSVICQPLATVASGTGMISVASGASTVTSNVCMLNSTSVPALGGIGTNSSTVNYSPGLNSVSNQKSNLTQIQSGLIGVGFTTATAATTSTGAGQVGPAVMGQHAVLAPSVPLVNAQPQQAQVPTPASTSSRFRVVKLDSTSESFKKGRWTCTEYYDKEAPENVPSTRTVESIRQFVPESVVCLERECVCGSSVSSSASHYTESLGSGETGGPSAVQQTFQQPPSQIHDYPFSNMSISQMQPQDVVHAHLKTNAGAPMPVSIQQPAGSQTTIGLSSTAIPPHMPKLTYAQAAQSSPAQALPVVTQQQMGYPPTSLPAAPAQVAPAGSLPPDFPQSKQIMNSVAPGPSQTLPHLATSIPPVAVSGNAQLIAPSQQPVGTVQTPAVAQPLPQGLLQPQHAPAPQMVQVPTGGVMPQLVQSAGTGLIQQTQGQQLTSHPSMEQQSHLSGQGRGPQFVPAVTSSLPTSSVPHNIQNDPQSSLMQNGSKEAGPGPTMMPTSLEDAQLLLLQHQALLMQSKPAGGECVSQTGTLLGQEGSSGVDALSASASLLKSLPVDGEEDGSSGASVVAIDNKIEQAMDLVKSHLMYAVREEVEVLKEQIKELIERNSQLEQENNLLKNLASPEQLAQFQAQVQNGSPPSSTQGVQPPAPSAQLAAQNSGPSA
ncbi:TSC22 domain family protein 1-like isoform X1 [Myxocyprinus asiaticus]|uniref:TSC22 domain family protein 1-like isoform X1 n=1 Tax=Myxocyprinus asiaticus TaxID=70543 RepID=UPI0022232FBC|nr:TSC22 domain family protein 1-like isoform X1 [Myxocyprinus asiaticus]